MTEVCNVCILCAILHNSSKQALVGLSFLSRLRSGRSANFISRIFQANGKEIVYR